MKKILLTIALSTLTTTAFAAPAGNTPNYDMYAPKAGGHEINAGLSVLHSNTTTNANVEDKGSGLGVNFTYAYGFTDNVAFHVGQKYYGYKNEVGNTTTDTKGFSGTTIGVKGLVLMDQPYFFYDAGYSLSLFEKRKSKGNETNVFSADSDPRDHLYAKVGIAMPIEMFTLGATYKFSMYQKTDLEVTGTTASLGTGNGSDWKVFAQYDFGTKIGLAYGESTVDGFDATVSNITTKTDKAESKMIQVYGIIPVTTEVDILADVTKTNLKDEGNYSKYDNYLVSVGAKINF